MSKIPFDNAVISPSVQTTTWCDTTFASDAQEMLDNTFHVSGAFVDSTRILTTRGEIPANLLKVGDKVPTYDAGSQPILGIFRKNVSASDAMQDTSLRPVLLRGPLFPGTTTLRVAPEHGVLHRSAQAEALFASTDVLVKARDLLQTGHALAEIPRTAFTFIQVVFERHCLVMAEGVWCETMLATQQGASARASVKDDKNTGASGQIIPVHQKTARPVLSQPEACVLLNGIRPRPRPIALVARMTPPLHVIASA